MSAYDINWDDNFLPLYGNTINIPTNTILWRGYDPKYPAISDRPAYYGSREFAQGYADKYDKGASPFITTRPLHLIDIRYMKVLLSQLFQQNQTTKADENIIAATTISFGICSLLHQIELFKVRYKAIYNTTNPAFNSLKEGIQNLESLLKKDSVIEQQGFRIAETTNDAMVMGFLKELFQEHYDGYIAPNIIIPFHVEKDKFRLNSELILFNPELSGIQLLKHIPPLIRITINNCILRSNYNYKTIDTRNIKTSYYLMKGGAHVCDDYNTLYDKGDKTVIAFYNSGIKAGKRWKKKPVTLYSAIARRPEVDPSILHSLDFNHYDKI